MNLQWFGHLETQTTRGLRSIIINSELSPPLYTDTQMLKKRQNTNFDVPLKIIPQRSLGLQERTDKIWSRYLHLQNRLVPFSHLQARCFLTTIFKPNKTVLRYVFFFKVSYIFNNNIYSIRENLDKLKNHSIQFWFV